MSLDLRSFSNCHIAVIGDVMLDRYWHGDTSRISPEAPVPVVKLADYEERLGGAANVAVNIRQLGAQATLVGVVGDDSPAKIIHQVLKHQGIENLLYTLDGQHTITKLRIVSRSQQLIRLDTEDGFELADPQALLSLAQQAVDKADTVILSDYNKGTLRPILSELIDYCREHNKPVLVDPKGGDFSIYRRATLLTPNMSEFVTAAGHVDTEDTLAEKAGSLIDYLSLSALLITRSEKGMSLFDREANATHLPAQVREVFDVTGAGDTVIATMATAMAARFSLDDSMTLANLAAGIVVGKRGTAFVTQDELAQTQSMSSSFTATQGVTHLNDLLPAIKEAKANRQTIVMTNGCFDLLHAGHVRYLNAARALGDCLIVAVNSDDSVSRLKGPTRPINPLAERMEVLAGLKAVDWVVPFSDDTPAALIEAIVPDKLVKGGDYVAEDIVGYDAVTSHGGEVLVIDLVEGCSTTSIIAKAQSSSIA